LVRELRRRRVFRIAGFCIVGAWLVMQAADVFFPGWGRPDAAINILLVTAILGFPLALVSQAVPCDDTATIPVVHRDRLLCEVKQPLS
jgi:hypothetical protein